MKKIAIVTGGSSGIGMEVAKELVNNNFIVYELSRHEFKMNGVHHFTTDVADINSVEKSINQILDIEKRVDLVINNAGFGISGAVEFTLEKDALNLFNVDFFGMVNINKCLLPQMRKQKSGKIINISSVAARIPIPFQTYYSAAKSAVNAYTLALKSEVSAFGIKVCAVMPGDIKTGFTAARQKSCLGDNIYNGRITKSVSTMEHDETTGMNAATAAKYIVKIALSNMRKPLYTIGFKYKCAIAVAKILPCSLSNYIVSKIY